MAEQNQNLDQKAGNKERSPIDSKTPPRAAGAQDQSSKGTMNRGVDAGADRAEKDEEDDSTTDSKKSQESLGSQQSNRPAKDSGNLKQ